MIILVFRCKALCDFCHDKWSELNNSKKALDERKQDKKKIRLYKKQHITGPKPPKKSGKFPIYRSPDS